MENGSFSTLFNNATISNSAFLVGSPDFSKVVVVESGVVNIDI